MKMANFRPANQYNGMLMCNLRKMCSIRINKFFPDRKYHWHHSIKKYYQEPTHNIFKYYSKKKTILFIHQQKINKKNTYNTKKKKIK